VIVFYLCSFTSYIFDISNPKYKESKTLTCTFIIIGNKIITSIIYVENINCN